MDNQELRDQTLECRLNENLTQDQLAEQIGISIATYNRFEQGKYKTNPITIAKIKKFLKSKEV